MFLSLKTLYRKRTVIWPFYFYTIIRTLSYSLNIIDVSTSNSISIIGIIIAAIITQLFLVFGEKKRSKK
ncbi:hypothetical protein EGW38_10040 [Enterococcus faecium]|nr:hypothetical protein EGW09_10270 [Enterococcus faecium]ROX48199.1 hypothetical protein EGW18_10270 [Enterococcus faecium]ROX79186.1 hypothetical protein EGW38_10040 [Enterococcus faecium]ROY29733.1 hypothetical protein EGW50_10030 [Enterococcus faecium]